MSLAQYRDGLTGSSRDVWSAVLTRQKAFPEHAIGHIDDGAFFRRPSIIEGTRLNSIAIIVQHMAGNMHSRWTGFLTSDGEKPWRQRDAEFSEPEHVATSRTRLMATWEQGWALIFTTLESLKPNDLDRQVTIRGKPHTVEAAVIRQIDHYALHVGQVVTTARLFVPESEWRYFTIPPGASAEFNQAMGMPEPDGTCE